MNPKALLFCITATAVTFSSALPSYANCGQDGCTTSDCKGGGPIAAAKTGAKSKSKVKAGKTTVEQKKAMAQKWATQVISGKNMDAMDDFVAEDAVMVYPPSFVYEVNEPTTVQGRANIKARIPKHLSASSVTMKDSEIIAEGNTVVMYRVASQKYDNGLAVDIPWVTIFKFNDAGKVAEVRHVFDTAHHKKALESASAK